MLWRIPFPAPRKGKVMSNRFHGPQGPQIKTAKNKGVLAVDQILRRAEAEKRYDLHAQNLPCQSSKCPYPISSSGTPRNSYQAAIKTFFYGAPYVADKAPVVIDPNTGKKPKLKAKERRKKGTGPRSFANGNGPLDAEARLLVSSHWWFLV
jgi:hypothetical protein